MSIRLTGNQVDVLQNLTTSGQIEELGYLCEYGALFTDLTQFFIVDDNEGTVFLYHREELNITDGCIELLDSDSNKAKEFFEQIKDRMLREEIVVTGCQKFQNVIFYLFPNGKIHVEIPRPNCCHSFTCTIPDLLKRHDVTSQFKAHIIEMLKNPMESSA